MKQYFEVEATLRVPVPAKYRAHYTLTGVEVVLPGTDTIYDLLCQYPVGDVLHKIETWRVVDE